MTTKRCDDLLGSCDFAQIRIQFQNFIFSRAEPKVFLVGSGWDSGSP
jgi:hypothetical protein